MEPARLIQNCIDCLDSYNPTIDTIDVHIEKQLGSDPTKVRVYNYKYRDFVFSQGVEFFCLSPLFSRAITRFVILCALQYPFPGSLSFFSV